MDMKQSIRRVSASAKGTCKHFNFGRKDFENKYTIEMKTTNHKLSFEWANINMHGITCRTFATLSKESMKFVTLIDGNQTE